MMQMRWLKAGLALAAVSVLTAPSYAQNLKNERANIVAVDWNAMQVRLKDPQGRETTWVVSRDAVVVFTDKASSFPNPKLKDLVPPMYVHFTYNADTKQIVKFDVVEVGFEPAAKASGSSGQAQAGQGAVITAIDMNVGQVEVQQGGARHTYWVEPKSQLRGYKAGDRVTLQVEQQGDKEVVTRISRRR
jgi:Cu/Ag efflux protein CusF